MNADSTVNPNLAAPKLVVNNLNFFFGEYRALKDINLSIAEKMVTAFIGPSGCGKSTLLRTFNRMYQLYPRQKASGEILLDGANGPPVWQTGMSARRARPPFPTLSSPSPWPSP